MCLCMLYFKGGVEKKISCSLRFRGVSPFFSLLLLILQCFKEGRLKKGGDDVDDGLLGLPVISFIIESAEDVDVNGLS